MVNRKPNSLSTPIVHADRDLGSRTDCVKALAHIRGQKRAFLACTLAKLGAEYIVQVTRVLRA